MPSATFVLTPPGGSDSECLPAYSTPSIAPPLYRVRSSHELSTILAMEEELDIEPGEAADVGKGYTTDSRSRLIPQALLVDASATLCAYLYLVRVCARYGRTREAA